MSLTLEFTILGSGSSGGVPRADGNWGACDPHDPRNRRSRCGISVRRKSHLTSEHWTTVLVDASPELRLQTAAAGIKRVDALLVSHDHADQTHGIDDLRPFFLNERKKIPCFMDADTSASLHRRFGYIFETTLGYPAICEARALPAHGQPWRLGGPSGEIPVVSFDLDHGGVRSSGFRFGPVGYSADVVAIPEPAFEILAGVEVLIIDALRYTPHPTHAHVNLALEWIARLQPRRAILTNLHIDLDYAELAARLPPGVEPAYDGLRFEVEV